MDVRCVYCAEPVDPRDPLTFQRVVGWGRKGLDPRRRSGSDIKLRRPLGQFAHGRCVERDAQGLAVGQEQLL